MSDRHLARDVVLRLIAGAVVAHGGKLQRTWFVRQLKGLPSNVDDDRERDDEGDRGKKAVNVRRCAPPYSSHTSRARSARWLEKVASRLSWRRAVGHPVLIVSLR